MDEKDKNSTKEIVDACDLLPEHHRQRLLGIAEGMAIAGATATKRGTDEAQA
jgi:hypothetical protein